MGFPGSFIFYNWSLLIGKINKEKKKEIRYYYSLEENLFLPGDMKQQEILFCWVLKEGLKGESSQTDGRAGSPRHVFPTVQLRFYILLEKGKKKFPPSHYKNNTGLQAPFLLGCSTWKLWIAYKNIKLFNKLQSNGAVGIPALKTVEMESTRLSFCKNK